MAKERFKDNVKGTKRLNPSLNFEEMYQQYGERVLNLAFRMTGNAEEARDLTQDIFVRIYENMDSYRGDAQVYTWIYRIATNHVLNHLKKSKRRSWMAWLDRSVGDAFRDEKDEQDIAAMLPQEKPDQKMEKNEREKIVWNAICQLPPIYRIPLVLNRYEEMSYNEIAEVMTISLNTVASRLHRATGMLAESLKPYLQQL